MPILSANFTTLTEVSRKHWDVVIVGSGISGATAFWRIQTSIASDMHVLVIDKACLPCPGTAVHQACPSEPSTYFASRDKAGLIEPWWDAQAVGGGFNVWYGQLGRFHSSCFSKTSSNGDDLGVDGNKAWPISYGDLAPYYTLIEKALLPYAAPDSVFEQYGNTIPNSNVTPRPQLSQFENLFGNNLSRSGWKCYVVPTCLGGRSWEQHPIDPVTGDDLSSSNLQRVKKDFKEFLLSNAKDNPNITLVCGARVESVSQNGDRISLCVADVNNCAASAVTFTASKLLLGCGAVETTRLLLGSPYVSANLPVGQNFNTSIELIGYISTDVSRNTDSDPLARFGHLGVPIADPATGGLGKIAIYDALRVDGYDKFKGYNVRFGATPPISRETFDRHFVLKFSFKGESTNWSGKRVSKQSNQGRMAPDLVLHYEDHPSDVAFLQYAESQVRMIADTLPGGKFLFGFRPTKAFGLSAHHHGGAVMGDEPGQSVTDRYGRVWGAEQISIIDASTFPTSGDLNGSLTIMANAARVTDWAISEETLS